MIEVGTNSYVSLIEANEYFSTKLHSEVWDSADDSTKQKALIEATRNLEVYRYRGYKANADQELSFPRVNIGRQPTDAERLVYGSSIKVIPKEVKNGQLEQALYLLEGKDEALEMASKGVNSFSAGGANMSIEGSKYTMLAPITKQYLIPYLSSTGVIR